jgi:hypothetical protein
MVFPFYSKFLFYIMDKHCSSCSTGVHAHSCYPSTIGNGEWKIFWFFSDNLEFVRKRQGRRSNCVTLWNTASMYHVKTPYNTVSITNIIITWASEKLSSTEAPWVNVLHCTPAPKIQEIFIFCKNKMVTKVICIYYKLSLCSFWSRSPVNNWYLFLGLK